MTYQTMDVHPIAGALGAEIYGADLRDRDDSPVWQELRQAFLEYMVIAIRGQDLGPADIMRIGAKFGEAKRIKRQRWWIARGVGDRPPPEIERERKIPLFLLPVTPRGVELLDRLDRSRVPHHLS